MRHKILVDIFFLATCSRGSWSVTDFVTKNQNRQINELRHDIEKSERENDSLALKVEIGHLARKRSNLYLLSFKEFLILT